MKRRSSQEKLGGRSTKLAAPSKAKEERKTKKLATTAPTNLFNHLSLPVGQNVTWFAT